VHHAADRLGLDHARATTRERESDARAPRRRTRQAVENGTRGEWCREATPKTRHAWRTEGNSELANSLTWYLFAPTSRKVCLRIRPCRHPTV
jgi:hypothetical protein